MCGLVGIAGEIQIKHEKMFKDMLRLDVLRGPHSTGIAAVTGTGDVIVQKKALLPDDLLSTKQSEDIFKKSLKVLIGHNRFATVGAVNGVNAHPFEMTDLTGAHNGTVDKWRLEDHTDFTVDSEALFHTLQKIGLDETLNKIKGAFALTWYNNKTKELNIIRNKERPLYIGIAKDTKTVMWASEEWMLVVAAGRNKVELDDVFSTEVHKHYTFDVFGDVKKYKEEAKEVKPFHYAATTTTTSNSSSTSSTSSSNQQTYNSNILGIPFTKQYEVGDDITFTIDKVYNSDFSSYVTGTVWGCDFRVKMYIPNHIRGELEQIVEEGAQLIAEIAGYRADSSDIGDAVIVDPNTAELKRIVEQDRDDEEDENNDTYLSNGVYIKRAHFVDPNITDSDCQWCANPLNFDDHPLYAGRYNGKRGHVCSNCEDIEEVKEYLKL